jgi:hypothetical protein
MPAFLSLNGCISMRADSVYVNKEANYQLQKGEYKMEKFSNMVKQCSSFNWGILLLFMGVLIVIPGDQSGIFSLGTGALLVGMNAARRLTNNRVNTFSLIVGLLALAAGIYTQFRAAWGLPHVEVGFLPLILIVAGLYVLIPRTKRTAQQ